MITKLTKVETHIKTKLLKCFFYVDETSVHANNLYTKQYKLHC